MGELNDLIKMLPYLGGIGGFLVAIFNWTFSALKEERNHYEKLYQDSQSEVLALKDEINKKEIEIVKLKASLKRDAFSNDERVKKDEKR